MSEFRENMMLQESQKEHASKVLNILKQFCFYIDVSPTGSGKTHIALHVAKTLNLPMIVIAPGNVHNMWKQKCKDHNITLFGPLTYGALVSKEGKQPTHGLLERNGNSFGVTKEFDDLINEGVMFVMDEAQNLKNSSYKNNACSIITKRICERKSKSIFALLSASLFDRTDCITNIMDVLGFIDHRYLHNVSYAKNFEDRCVKMANKNLVPYKYSENSFMFDEFLFHCYMNYIKNLVSSSMAVPVYDREQKLLNSFYTIDNDKLKNILGILNEIKKQKEEKKQQHILELLESIESHKTSLFVRIGKQILDENPNKKLIIAINQLSNLGVIEEFFKDYGSIAIDGSIVFEKRSRIYSKFNEPNNDLRVLVTTQSICTGFDLQDTDGSFPRHMLISPSYSAINVHQSIGRINRIGLKSDTVAEIIYVKGARDEYNIISSLERKSEILSKTHNAKFPSEFDTYEEH